MYTPGSLGTVPRYMSPDMVVAGSGWRRAEVHGVEQGGLWCSQRGRSIAVWGEVDGERSGGTLQFMGFDVVVARHRSCVGMSFADPRSVRR